MKIIDLLNKIANGEIDYEQQIKIDNEIINVSVLLGTYVFGKERLNDEVEIIEEDKKIEKLKWNEKSSYNQEGDTKKVQKILLSRSEQLKSSINEIIDYLEEKE